MENNKNMVPLAIIIAGALIAGAVYMGGNRNDTVAGARQVGAPNVGNIEVSKVTDKDHILGNPNADLVIVEYSDLECPFCKVFHNTMKQVVSEYGDKVAWVYRHFPIAQLHKKAFKEAEATECATEQGGNTIFWKYTDELLARSNSNDSLDPAELPKIASTLGLDVNAFNNCLSSGKYTKFIQESVVAAGKAGAQGTPYSVIIAKNGDKVIINGAEPIESVKAKIDALLK